VSETRPGVRRCPGSKLFMLALPPAPSWFPGHMAAFAKALPSLLTKAHVVLEVRDARLPLTSVNSHLEASLVEWLNARHKTGGVRERIVVYTKKDLVPSWGEQVREIIRAIFTTLILREHYSVLEELWGNISITISILSLHLLPIPFEPCIPVSYVRLPICAGFCHRLTP
jgi:hypothetical protein